MPETRFQHNIIKSLKMLLRKADFIINDLYMFYLARVTTDCSLFGFLLYFEDSDQSRSFSVF